MGGGFGRMGGGRFGGMLGNWNGGPGTQMPGQTQWAMNRFGGSPQTSPGGMGYGQINLPANYRPQGLGMPGSLPPTFGQLQAGMPTQPGFGGGGFDQSFGTSPAPLNAAGQSQSWTDFYGLPPVGTSSGVKFGQSVGGMPSLMAMNNGSALPPGYAGPIF
jgi:hypothetical protein